MQAPRSRAGFTLIELLVVVSLIGILAAIAIPQFLGRQSKAYDARSMNDARAAAMAEEAYFDDNSAYYAGPCSGLPNMVESPGVSCNAALAGTGFQVTTSHPQGSKTCVWSTLTVPTLICS